MLTAGLVEYNQSMGGWWKGGFNVGFSVTDGQTKSKTKYIPVHLTGQSISNKLTHAFLREINHNSIRFCT